jgi:acetoacetate decarboxylase
MAVNRASAIRRPRGRPVKEALLPVLEIISAQHILAVLTLGLGAVVHDYPR